jgi:hypothetical protein
MAQRADLSKPLSCVEFHHESSPYTHLTPQARGASRDDPAQVQEREAHADKDAPMHPLFLMRAHLFD